MVSLIHRGFHQLLLLIGLVLGIAGTVFAYSNTGSATISMWRLHWDGVPIGMLALVPLVAGLVAGYLYHLPARMHHFTEHMRHRSLVHHLEKENKELRHSLDKLLEMPDRVEEARALPARPAAALGEPSEAPAAGASLAELMEAEPVVVHEVKRPAAAARSRRAPKPSAADALKLPRRAPKTPATTGNGSARSHRTKASKASPAAAAELS